MIKIKLSKQIIVYFYIIVYYTQRNFFNDSMFANHANPNKKEFFHCYIPSKNIKKK